MIRMSNVPFNTRVSSTRIQRMLITAGALRVDTRAIHESAYQHWYSPTTSWPLIPISFWRLDRYRLDVKEVLAALEEVNAEWPLRPFPKDKRRKQLTYRGLGLTARPGAEDPEYDGLTVYGNDGTALEVENVLNSVHERNNSPLAMEVDETTFSVPTRAMRPTISKVLAQFKSPLTKVRVLSLQPGGVLASHVDFPYYKTIRLHAVLTTNPDTYWEADGYRVQIPADGRFYWMDVGKPHAVWNVGETPRLVLSVNLMPYFNRDGTPREETSGRNLIDLMEEGLL